MVNRRAPGNGTGDLVPDRLLTVGEASHMLGLKKAALYMWSYERKIPTVKPNGPRGPLRFRLSTLLRLIEQWEQPALGPSRLERP